MSTDKKRVAETITTSQKIDPAKLNQLERTLIEAAKKGDLGLAKSLANGNIPKQADVNTLLGKTISTAAYYGRVGFIGQFLFQGKVRLSEELASNLLLAALENALHGWDEFLELAKTAQKPPDELKEDLVSTAYLILNYCLREKIKVDFEREDSKGRTALMLASELGLETMVKTLLENGADVLTKAGRMQPFSNYKGHTALHFLCSQVFHKNINIMDMLLAAGADKLLSEMNEKHPLIQAAQSRLVHFLKRLIELTPAEVLTTTYQRRDNVRVGILIHLVDCYYFTNIQTEPYDPKIIEERARNLAQKKKVKENFLEILEKHDIALEKDAFECDLEENPDECDKQIFSYIELLIQKVGEQIVIQQGTKIIEDIIMYGRLHNDFVHFRKRIKLLNFLIEKKAPLEKKSPMSGRTVIELAFVENDTVAFDMLRAAGANTRRLNLPKESTTSSEEDNESVNQVFKIDFMPFWERLYPAKKTLAEKRKSLGLGWLDFQLDVRPQLFKDIGTGNFDALIELMLMGADINFGGPCTNDFGIGSEWITIGAVSYKTFGITPLQFIFMQSKEIAAKMFILITLCEAYPGEIIDLLSANLYTQTKYNSSLKDLSFLWQNGKTPLRNYYTNYEQRYYAKREEFEREKFQEQARTIVQSLILSQYEQFREAGQYGPVVFSDDGRYRSDTSSPVLSIL